MAKTRIIRRNHPLILSIDQAALAERMDPGFWDPKYDEAMECVRKGPFGETLTPISRLLDQTGISQGSKGKSTYVKEGLPYVRIGNMRLTGVDLSSDVRFVEENGPMDRPGSRPQPGYVLVVRTGATIGKVAIWLDESPPAAVSSVIYKLNFSGVNPYFACTYLKSQYGQSQLERMKNGAAVENLNLEEVSSIQMVVPPEEVQSQVETEYRDMSKHHLSAMKAANEGRRIDRDNELKIARLKLEDLLSRFTDFIAGTREKL